MVEGERAIERIVEPTNVLNSSEPLSKALALIKESAYPHVVVLKEGAYYGVIDDRVVRKFKGDAERTECWIQAKKAPTLSRGSALEEIVANFLNSEVKVLPVLEGVRVLGVVTRRGVLQLVRGLELLRSQRVGERMSVPCATVSEGATIAQARAIMRATGYYRLAVVDRRERLVGVFSSYDLATKVEPYMRKRFREATFRETPEAGVERELVSLVMTSDVATIEPGLTLAEAVEKMLSRGVFSLVVVRDNKPLGMLTFRDVLEACVVMPPEPIYVIGLDEREAMLRIAIYDEAAALLERLKKSFNVAYIVVTIKKSSPTGFRHRYIVRARALVDGRLFTSREPEVKEHREQWDLHMAVKEALAHLERNIYEERKRSPRTEALEWHRIR